MKPTREEIPKEELEMHTVSPSTLALHVGMPLRL